MVVEISTNFVVVIQSENREMTRAVRMHHLRVKYNCHVGYWYIKKKRSPDF